MVWRYLLRQLRVDFFCRAKHQDGPRTDTALRLLFAADRTFFWSPKGYGEQEG